MYYEFFGLTQAPFRITPNTDFFFSGGNRGPILEALIYAVTHGEGIVKVSGEVGSGKTMLCNMLMARLPPNVETVYIANPNISPDEILQAVAFDLHLNITPNATRLEVMRALQDHLLARYGDGKRVVVFVEESQGMPLETLEEIRLLSNLETRNDKLLQIVLFGQPELDNNLRNPGIRQLRDRITHSFTLSPLTAAEIREYLMFRMRAAGYHGPDLFSEAVVRLIARGSAGLTRRVNLIADKALLAAFSENTHTLKPRHVEVALRDSEFTDVARDASPNTRWVWIAAVACSVAVGAAGHAWLSRGDPETGGKAAVAASPAPQPTPPAATASAPRETEKPAAEDAKAIVPNTGATAAGVPPKPAPAPEKAESAEPPQPEAPPSTAKTVDGDLLQQRIVATDSWLAAKKGNMWTIQVLSTAAEDNLKSHLDNLKKSIEINNIYVYRAAGGTDQRPVFSVFYGSYDSQAVAELELARLPAPLRSNGPWPRTVQSIRGKGN